MAAVPRPANDRHGLDPSLTSYLVDKAYGDRPRVSAHVESAHDFDVAVAARADLIAHIPGRITLRIKEGRELKLP